MYPNSVVNPTKKVEPQKGTFNQLIEGSLPHNQKTGSCKTEIETKAHKGCVLNSGLAEWLFFGICSSSNLKKYIYL